jgi:glyoxylase-like metal-dependent hydrolase (beta-lactamase superfamily II)
MRRRPSAREVAVRVGEMRIDAVIDGESLFPGPTWYSATTEDDWLEYAQHLEPVMGRPLHLCTVGGHLVRWRDRVVLVDLGVGPKPRYPFVGGSLRSVLAGLGVARGDVTDVVFTHLHFDHIGWASIDGEAFFPNARHWVDAREWEHFYVNYEMTPAQAAAMSPEDAPNIRLRPVADRIEFFASEHEVLPGINALEAAGHTPGHAVLELVSDGERALLIGDLVHSQPQLLVEGAALRDKWRFDPDLDCERACASIERFQRVLVDERLPFAGGHMAGLPWSRLRRGAHGGLILERTTA